MSDVVYATESFAVGVDGSTVWVEAGTSHPVDAPVVKVRPELFTAEAPDGDEQPEQSKRRGGRRG